MFENPEVAKHVLQVFLSINGQMNECIEAIEKKASPECQELVNTDLLI